jgi:uncharacterized protein
MIAVDTNLLVYAHRSGLPEHRSAIQALEAAFNRPSRWGLPQFCIAEFWSIVTHPRFGPRPSTPKEAEEFVAGILRDGDGDVWMPGHDFVFRLMQLAIELGVRGSRIFDLQIALVSFENGATELWTHDRSFQKIPGLKVLDPLI